MRCDAVTRPTADQARATADKHLARRLPTADADPHAAVGVAAHPQPGTVEDLAATAAHGRAGRRSWRDCRCCTPPSRQAGPAGSDPPRRERRMRCLQFDFRVVGGRDGDQAGRRRHRTAAAWSTTGAPGQERRTRSRCASPPARRPSRTCAPPRHWGIARPTRARRCGARASGTPRRPRRAPPRCPTARGAGTVRRRQRIRWCRSGLCGRHSTTTRAPWRRRRPSRRGRGGRAGRAPPSPGCSRAICAKIG